MQESTDAPRDVPVTAALVGHTREASAEEIQCEVMGMRPADAKVWTIIEMMIALKWVRGKSADDLAIQWGCSLQLVERYAVEASRFLRLIKEPELLRARVLKRLAEIGEQDEGDRVPALLGAAKVAGVLDAPKAQAAPQESAADRLAAAESALDDPPPELVELLERKWGKRTVGV